MSKQENKKTREDKSKKQNKKEQKPQNTKNIFLILLLNEKLTPQPAGVFSSNNLLECQHLPKPPLQKCNA
jgi:hypothetical protein